ncbi:MAG: iron-hydroxamate ABC transporter substrate-binding protein [Paeniclostridium sp.]|uniref:iron-hydroxamate ABC transporter substrate-binding protein n=1 Tax=Paraclostridium sordellii TaxID=1505 RepID=UPI0005DF846D|nr:MULTISPECIES: iron-hydroxamate ABC transporter substrate-binding protein [Paeniclostridium]MBW4863617.1 iron-hydroxamate ABC transporter substrate-binding protein [Paeniclostridium sp.]MBW4874389.1 iron-hydroxamate ABC transporter substrate-binding protein [Paeniclostridium sp.]CEN93430.1 iron compound ABC transporter iron compound-binding protein [[Clostridium] sordellii] [Paeniclostridium sordellii]CEN94849.1 iron compound ABC transporter iron compound-binding protein [[Clostridium] sordel
MKRFKSLVVLGATIATLGLVTGCSGGNSESTKTKEETRVVQSVKGEVKIPTDPNRIVDISGSSEELVLLGHTPVGTANVDSYKTDKVPSYIEDKLGKAKVVGHSMMDTMDIEAILQSNPDLIIMAPRQEKIYDQLKEIAPVVMLEDKSNDWEAKFKDVAKLFGQEKDAQKWLDEYYTKAKKVGDEIKKANGEDKTYLTVLASSGQFMVFTEGGIGTVLKTDMGLPQPSNMPKQDSITLPTVTMEGLTEIDPDHIIVIGTESDKADLEKSTVWKEMRAVKDGNVTILDSSPYFSQAYNPIGRELLLESIKDKVVNK